MDAPETLPGGPDQEPAREGRKLPLPGPAVLLAFWLLFKGAFDALVLIAARHGVLSLPFPSSFQTGWTLAEVAATLFIALGLWERARWGWWSAVGFTIYSLISGTVSVLLEPPPGACFIVGLAYAYHGVILFLLASGLVRRDVFGPDAKPGPRWLKSLALAVFLVGVIFLTRRYWLHWR